MSAIAEFLFWITAEKVRDKTTHLATGKSAKLGGIMSISAKQHQINLAALLIICAFSLLSDTVIVSAVVRAFACLCVCVIFFSAY